MQNVQLIVVIAGCIVFTSAVTRNIKRWRTKCDNAKDVLSPLPRSAATHDCNQQRLGAAVQQRCEDTDNVDTFRTL